MVTHNTILKYFWKQSFTSIKLSKNYIKHTANIDAFFDGPFNQIDYFTKYLFLRIIHQGGANRKRVFETFFRLGQCYTTTPNLHFKRFSFWVLFEIFSVEQTPLKVINFVSGWPQNLKSYYQFLKDYWWNWTTNRSTVLKHWGNCDKLYFFDNLSL